MPATPLLSVLMPAFNARAYIREAIESVLDNGFADFELIVIDDGSADDTAQVVESIGHPALRLERNGSHLGVGVTRGRTVALARGRNLAMLDADDVAVPGRFAAQVERLEAADGPDIIGGGIEYFGDGYGNLLFARTDPEIRAGLVFFDLPIANGAACMKAQPLREGVVRYGSGVGAEDYALWADALVAGLRFENLPFVVTRVRRHAQSLTRQSREPVIAQARIVRLRIVEFLFSSLDAAEQAALVAALSVNLGGGQRWIDGACALAHAAELAGGVRGADAATLRRLLAQNFLRMLSYALSNGLIDNETLEMMTETNTHFERWRRADGGMLDREIMTMIASGA
jgi:glycosyltransferase involved in cell wall biosynthesis